MKLLTHLQRGPDDDDRSHGRHNIIGWDRLCFAAQQTFLLGFPFNQSGGVGSVLSLSLGRGDDLLPVLVDGDLDLARVLVLVWYEPPQLVPTLRGFLGVDFGPFVLSKLKQSFHSFVSSAVCLFSFNSCIVT